MATKAAVARAKAGAKKGEKVDLFALHKGEYAMPKTPAVVEVGPAKYLAIEGRGEPGSAEFQACIGALYGMAYTLKMTKKFAGQDYKVCALEGLYWCDGEEFSPSTPKENLRWKLLIRVPDFISDSDLAAARAQLLAKGKSSEVERVFLETLNEGRCLQVLHVGPYCDEWKTVATMREIAGREQLVFHGVHHEVYLSDPRRVAPERLRTILRHPVLPA